MSEGKYKTRLTKKIERRFPGCLVLRNDSSYIQGIPDILVLFGNCWAALEAKISAKAEVQPNQPYYVDRMNSMSFAAFIHPDNEEEVLDAMEQAFAAGWHTRVS
ncbi:MAG TPA: hypothetical protein VIY48_20430 [Candidatus Paceibacterota bacterium]